MHLSYIPIRTLQYLAIADFHVCVPLLEGSSLAILWKPKLVFSGDLSMNLNIVCYVARTLVEHEQQANVSPRNFIVGRSILSIMIFYYFLYSIE